MLPQILWFGARQLMAAGARSAMNHSLTAARAAQRTGRALYDEYEDVRDNGWDSRQGQQLRRAGEIARDVHRNNMDALRRGGASLARAGNQGLTAAALIGGRAVNVSRSLARTTQQRVSSASRAARSAFNRTSANVRRLGQGVSRAANSRLGKLGISSVLNPFAAIGDLVMGDKVKWGDKKDEKDLAEKEADKIIRKQGLDPKIKDKLVASLMFDKENGTNYTQGALGLSSKGFGNGFIRKLLRRKDYMNTHGEYGFNDDKQGFQQVRSNAHFGEARLGNLLPTSNMGEQSSSLSKSSISSKNAIDVNVISARPIVSALSAYGQRGSIGVDLSKSPMLNDKKGDKKSEQIGRGLVGAVNKVEKAAKESPAVVEQISTFKDEFTSKFTDFNPNIWTQKLTAIDENTSKEVMQRNNLLLQNIIRETNNLQAMTNSLIKTSNKYLSFIAYKLGMQSSGAEGKKSRLMRAAVGATAVSAVGASYDLMGEGLDWLKKETKPALDWLNKTMEPVTKWFVKQGEELKNSEFVKDLNKGVDKVKEQVSSFFDDTFMTDLKTNFDAILQLFKDVGSALWSAVKAIAKTLYARTTTLRAVIQFVVKFFWKYLLAPLAWVGSKLANIIEKVLNPFGEAMMGLASLFETFGDWFRSSFLGKMLGLNKGGKLQSRKEVMAANNKAAGRSNEKLSSSLGESEELKVLKSIEEGIQTGNKQEAVWQKKQNRIIEEERQKRLKKDQEEQAKGNVELNQRVKESSTLEAIKDNTQVPADKIRREEAEKNKSEADLIDSLSTVYHDKKVLEWRTGVQLTDEHENLMSEEESYREVERRVSDMTSSLKTSIKERQELAKTNPNLVDAYNMGKGRNLINYGWDNKQVNNLLSGTIDKMSEEDRKKLVEEYISSGDVTEEDKSLYKRVGSKGYEAGGFGRNDELFQRALIAKNLGLNSMELYSLEHRSGEKAAQFYNFSDEQIDQMGNQFLTGNKSTQKRMQALLGSGLEKSLRVVDKGNKKIAQHNKDLEAIEKQKEEEINNASSLVNAYYARKMYDQTATPSQEEQAALDYLQQVGKEYAPPPQVAEQIKQEEVSKKGYDDVDVEAIKYAETNRRIQEIQSLSQHQQELARDEYASLIKQQEKNKQNVIYSAIDFGHDFKQTYTAAGIEEKRTPEEITKDTLKSLDPALVAEYDKYKSTLENNTKDFANAIVESAKQISSSLQEGVSAVQESNDDNFFTKAKDKAASLVKVSKEFAVEKTSKAIESSVQAVNKGKELVEEYTPVVKDKLLKSKDYVVNKSSEVYGEASSIMGRLSDSVRDKYEHYMNAKEDKAARDNTSGVQMAILNAGGSSSNGAGNTIINNTKIPSTSKSHDVDEGIYFLNSTIGMVASRAIAASL